MAEQGESGLSGAAQVVAANAAAVNKPSAEFVAASLEERIEGQYGPVMSVSRLGVRNITNSKYLIRPRARRCLIRARAQATIRLGTAVR